jgi:hypothetical protein
LLSDKIIRTAYITQRAVGNKRGPLNDDQERESLCKDKISGTAADACNRRLAIAANSGVSSCFRNYAGRKHHQVQCEGLRPNSRKFR